MKSLLLCAAAAVAVLAGGTAVQAQHGHGHSHGHSHGFGYGGHGHGFSYGYGGHLHGHVHGHQHHHGLPLGYYGSYGVGYPYAYGTSRYYPSVVTAPAVVAAPVAVVPAAGVTTSTSLKPNAIPPYNGPGVTLRLPAEYPGSVYVQVDKREVEIKPGTAVVLKDKASYLVEFDRGGGFGTSSGEITEGAYKFQVADKGWFIVPDAPADGGLRRNSLPGEPKK